LIPCHPCGALKGEVNHVPVRDLANEVGQLLAIHESDRRAHFETSAKQIMEHATDEFISVS
jgi:hypothetical protein